MNYLYQPILLILYIFFEIVGTAYTVEVKRRYIRHGVAAFVRIVLICLIILFPFDWSIVNRALTAFFFFWFAFDYGLNIARNYFRKDIEDKLPFYWLGYSSFIDQIQRKTLPIEVWFVFKVLAFTFCSAYMFFDPVTGLFRF